MSVSQSRINPASQSCPTQDIAPTTPRSWAVCVSSSIQQWHWQASWHLVTRGHVMSWPVFEMWMMRRHIWISTLQDTRVLVQPVTCFSAVMGRGWGDRLVTALGRMEFHVIVSTINKEANTDSWKRWPIQAARQITLRNIHCLTDFRISRTEDSACP